MRARTYIFECEKHREFGENGWRLRGNGNADPLPGLAVSHDIMEHLPNGDMGVEDELMALGASVYVRQYSDNMHSLGGNIGADLPDILCHAFFEDMGIRKPHRTCALESGIESEWDEALDSLHRELQYDDDLREKVTPEIYSRIRGWFRIGYRRAMRRWDGIHTREIFYAIRDEADRRLKWAELGDSMHVRLTFSRSQHRRSVSFKVWMGRA